MEIEYEVGDRVLVSRDRAKTEAEKFSPGWGGDVPMDFPFEFGTIVQKTSTPSLGYRIQLDGYQHALWCLGFGIVGPELKEGEEPMNKQEWLLIGGIVKRADNEGLMRGNRLSLMMDLEAVYRTVGLRLQDLIVADTFNFAHDILGIQNNMDRSGDGKLINCFLPRFSGKSKGTEWEDAVHLLMNEWDRPVRYGLITKKDMVCSLTDQVSGDKDYSPDEKEFADPNNHFSMEEWTEVVYNAAQRWLLRDNYSK